MADYTYDQVINALRNADAAGDVEAAKRLAQIAAGMSKTTQQQSEENQTESETARLARSGKKEEPSIVQQMIGIGSPTYSAVRGAFIEPLLGINQLLSKVFPEQVQREATRIVGAERQAYEQGRQQMGREGIDISQFTGAIVSPANRLLSVARAPTIIGRIAQGAGTGAVYAGTTPTTQEDNYVSEKLLQMGLGAVIGGGIPVTVEVAKRIKNIIKDLPITEEAKARAFQKYVVEQAGDNPEELRKILKEAKEIVPGSAPTTAEALAETAAGAKFAKDQQRISKMFPERFVTREQQQQAARQAELERTFGTPEELAAAERLRYTQTAPMREEALSQANIYGQLGPRLEAEIAARMGVPGEQRGLIGALQGQGKAASEAVQAEARAGAWTPVPGYPRFPGRYSPNMERAIEFKKTASEIGDIVQQRKAEVNFKQMQLKSLTDEGFYPLSVNPLVDKIEKSLVTPGERSNSLLVNAQQRIKDKLLSYADENGIINSVDLYNVRKEIGEDIKDFLASRGNASFGAQATAVEKALKSRLDDAIQTASGSDLWKKYLVNYAKHSEKINQMTVGQKLQEVLGGNFDKEAAGTFATAIKNAPTIIKKTTGQQRYEKLEEFLTPDQMSSVNRVLADLTRKQKSIELAKKAESTGGIKTEGGELVPGMLSSVVTFTKQLLNAVKRGSQKELDSKLAELYLDPQKFSMFLEQLNKKEAEGVGKALASRMSPAARDAFNKFLIQTSSMAPTSGELTRGTVQQMVAE